MTTEKTNRLQKLVLPAVILIFTAPMLISWWLLNFTDYSKGNIAASHGDLINPPRPLNNLPLTNISSVDGQASLHGKWSLVYLLGGKCDQECTEVLYKIRQVRLATGKYSPRIQRVLFVGGADSSPLSQELKEFFPGQLLFHYKNIDEFPLLEKFKLGKEEDAVVEKRLYLVDPLGNLMMSFPAKAEPSGIIKDLKKLLRYSRIG
jgi:hypothetical protein